MKRTPFIRLLALALALFMLAACNRTESAPAQNEQAETTAPATEPVVTEPQQKEMPAEEKEAALRRMEYALLCAAIDTEDRLDEMEGYIHYNNNVYVGDYNGDGAEDLLCGPYTHIFDALNRRTTYRFSQSGTDLYTDKDGVLYLEEGMGGGNDYYIGDQLVFGDGQDTWYKAWNGSEWISVLGYYTSRVREIIVDENGNFAAFGETLEETSYGIVHEQRVTMEEYEAAFAELGLTKVETYARDFTRLSYDGAYADDLLTAIWDRLGSIYGLELVTADYDGDGQEENLYFFHNIGSYWYDRFVPDEFQELDPYNSYKDMIDIHRDQRYVLLADREDGKLNITAGCIPAGISVHQGMDIRMDGGFLWVGNTPMYLPGTELPAESAWVGDYVQLHGYSNCLTRAVDLSDLPGNEYMCLAQKDGVWYLIILIVVDGTPRTVLARSLENTALYLTEQDGKQCLLLYGQYVRTLWDGRLETAYDYSLMRIDGEGEMESLDYQYHSFTADEPDATATAAFFEKLNVYIIRIVVVRDPFLLTGKMWMTPDDQWTGNVPQEPEQTQPDDGDETEEPVMGFVQINDPSSWLNLRVGPGVEYDKVLVDPGDPNSFVKQALGSPVTVLEHVTAADGSAWVKVRITYADREFVGYSSKTYIRIPGEE